MKPFAIASLALLGAVAPQGGFEWLTDLDAARATAMKEKKPLLIVFR